MKICIIDKIGLCYDGNTLEKQGLGGSESAVIYIAAELSKLNFDVTVFNNCIDLTHSTPGVYNGVRYIDNTQAADHLEIYDIVIVSRTVAPFLNNDYPFLHFAKKRILWLHDTFVDGDQFVEDLAISGKIDHIFTLSDWHTTYILNATHGKRRNFEVLKKKIFQTRNGAQQHINDIDLSKKDRNHFVYNASASKGMLPLVNDIWPEIKKQIPEARLTIIGGYYRFREGAIPDEQEKTVLSMMSREDLKAQGIEFTGVIKQNEIAKILANASLMLYPGAFPETFGISSLESLLYNTPLVTTRFGALEETAVEQACYLIDYAIEPNALFPHIDKSVQVKKFLDMFFYAYNNQYLLQQKQNYCNVVKDVAGWNTVALQWKQFFYSIMGDFLPIDDYRKVSRINQKVARVFGRTNNMPALKEYKSYGNQRKIVIVSPFWNAENYIEKNILSVASQDYENYTHILINDASTDQSHLKIDKTINKLPDRLRSKFKIQYNIINHGAIYNQLSAIKDHVKDDDIVILLDGDDWLINNNTIFHYYNDIYNQGYEFTYGSMWSLVDNIPLISQEYPPEVKNTRSYRKHLFNWKIPYTHLRTVLGKHIKNLDESKFKDKSGNWMRSGHDNPLFYELIERVDPDKIYCNHEIVCNYNDTNPLNDYKIRGEEQNKNANLSYEDNTNLKKRILLAIPTNKYIEPDTFKSLWNLTVPDGYELEFQYFYGYQIDQIRNLIAHWAAGYDYLLCIDSDIVVPKDALVKMLSAKKDIISGLYIQRIPDQQILEIYLQASQGAINAKYENIKNSGIIEIAACGMGCCLIDSKVIRSMKYPHFVYKSAINHAHTFSEDIYFCFKSRELGFKVWADTSIHCEHIGQTRFVLPNDTIPAFSKENYVTEIANKDLLPADHVEYLKNMNINPKVIYDIGACVLHWTRKAKEVWPNAEYYLFDANPDVAPILEKSGHSFWIDVLTDKDSKKLTFYKKDNNLGGNSYYMETTGEYSESDGVEVVGWTLDKIVSDNSWSYPDLIKIDVQGAEIDILIGAKNCLKHCSDVILEAQHIDYNKGAPKLEAVINFMKSQGFEMIAKISQGYADADYHFKRVLESF